MFKSFVRGALVACTLATGLAGVGAVPASAASVVISGNGVHVVPVQYRRDGRRGGSCSSRLALRKAYGLGVNRPRIVRDNRRAVVVDGFRRGRPITVRFRNDRGCPVLAVRR